MRLSLFGPLADTLEAVPSCAILKTLERMSKMLRDDLLHNRPLPVREIESLLDFCDFVEAVREQKPMERTSASIAIPHIQLYERTIKRLIAAGELPDEARAQFENTFFSVPGRIPAGFVAG